MASGLEGARKRSIQAEWRYGDVGMCGEGWMAMRRGLEGKWTGLLYRQVGVKSNV